MPDVKKILRLLFKKYPGPGIALSFSNPLELLIAAILSARCTDIKVNEVTGMLFRKYKNARDYVRADIKKLEAEIKPTGFYRNKAKMVIACCRKLVEDYNGDVPSTLQELTKLPGVGRKTANVVLGSAFGRPAIAVDTHVLRVSNRLGLAHSQDPDRVEEDLMKLIPEKHWTALTLALILHGRETCAARGPKCASCVLYSECEWPDKAA